ncbi:hypothetical protein D3C79_745710 [compost metagenome]
MGFIQRLGDVEGFLRAEAELLRAQFLQGTEVEGQGRGLAYPFGGHLHHAGAGGIADGGGGLLGQDLIEAATLIIAGVFGGTPLCAEARSGAVEHDIDGPKCHGHEVGNTTVAIHHQAQGRGLHPAHRQYTLITGLAPEQGEQAAHVHPDQPVGARAAQGRMVQTEGFTARFERGQGLANRSVVQG